MSNNSEEQPQPVNQEPIDLTQETNYGKCSQVELIQSNALSVAKAVLIDFPTYYAYSLLYNKYIKAPAGGHDQITLSAGVYTAVRASASYLIRDNTKNCLAEQTGWDKDIIGIAALTAGFAGGGIKYGLKEASLLVITLGSINGLLYEYDDYLQEENKSISSKAVDYLSSSLEDTTGIVLSDNSESSLTNFIGPIAIEGFEGILISIFTRSPLVSTFVPSLGAGVIVGAFVNLFYVPAIESIKGYIKDYFADTNQTEAEFNTEPTMLLAEIVTIKDEL